MSMSAIPEARMKYVWQLKTLIVKNVTKQRAQQDLAGKFSRRRFPRVTVCSVDGNYSKYLNLIEKITVPLYLIIYGTMKDFEQKVMKFKTPWKALFCAF